RHSGQTVDTTDNRDGALEYLAPKLDVELTKLVESPQSEWHQRWAFTRYNIVGHSQGGLLVRMLCTSKDPPSLAFKSFRSDNNAYRGRFHRVITLNAPHNGSTFAHYCLKEEQAGHLIPTGLRVAGVLQDKFDPFG